MKIGYRKGFRDGYDEGYTAGHAQAEVDAVPGMQWNYLQGTISGFEYVLGFLKKVKSPDELAEVIDEIEVVLAQAASGQ